MSKENIVNSCPYCSSEEGFYLKGFMKGRYIYRFNYDGSEAENGDLYDSLSCKEGKTAYCQSCHKIIKALGR
jgi:hypothetical protein